MNMKKLSLLLALAGVTSSVVQERMAGNVRDRNVALQAAEAALRDAEQDVLANLDAAAGFVDACTGGLCLPPSMVASGAQSQLDITSLRQKNIYLVINPGTGSGMPGEIEGQLQIPPTP